MSLRQAISGFVKRLRYPSQIAKPSVSLRITTTSNPVLFIGMNADSVLAEGADLDADDNTSAENLAGLRKIEDGSVVSNIHTSKWRVFTDTGRERFFQGKLEDAERLFQAAIQEAKEGFGERDPHVASACNNLAELYRVQKAFDKAEPLYLEAINVLEESLGSDDIRVGAALHNLGQFYIGQRKLDEARVFYERALKIKRRVLGEGHTDYADTMYHLGTVLYLQGKGKDSEALIQDSIRILEDGGQGESILCIRRLRYLAQIYIKSNQPAHAENIQRKILQKMELSKGWNSLDTVIAAENLALTLQSVGSLTEAHELLERCLNARKSLLSEDHIQIAANLLHIARLIMLNFDEPTKARSSEAISELHKAKELLGNAIRIARYVLDNLIREEKKKSRGILRESRKDGHAALMILLQSLDALGMLEITKMEIPEHKKDHTSVLDAEKALHQCLSAFKEYGTWRSLSSSSEAKTEYLFCLRHLSALLDNGSTGTTNQSRRTTLQELRDEIKSVEGELAINRTRKT